MKGCIPVRVYFLVLLAFLLVLPTVKPQGSEMRPMKTDMPPVYESGQYPDVHNGAAIHTVNQTWIVVLSVAIVFVLLFAVFSFRSYQVKQAHSKDLRRLVHELERKNSVLEKNNDFHKKLISIMAHDLRQPFASMIMLDKTAAKEAMGKE